MRNNPIASMVAALLLTACTTVGPDYQAPRQVADIDFSSPYSRAERALSWWQVFEDPHLDRLIELTLANNRELEQASANVERAYAVFHDVDHNRWPQGSLDAGYQAGENGTVASDDDGVIARGYRSGLGLSWDPDLFGKLRRASQAARAEAEQARILWHDAQLRLVSQVATSYGEYRGAQLRLEVARQNLDNLRQTRDIIQARFDAGLASELELVRIDAQLLEVAAGLPDHQLALLTAETTLAALVGSKPGPLQLGERAELPRLAQPVAIADGTNYLRYRADVAGAERALAARTADIGVATADLYPSLSFSGFLGFVSGPGWALGADQRSWSIAPGLSWQAADLGSVRARIRAAGAGRQMALAEFEQKVIDALGEMQLALHGYNLGRERQLGLELQWQASNKAVAIARARYQAGSGDFLELLDAEREQLRSRDRMAQQEQDSFSRLVAVYRSFGGGIEPL